MTTYTDTYGFNKNSAGFPAFGASARTISVELDFAAITTARSAASATALGAGDVLEVISLPAKTLVLAVGLDVTTAEGGTLTIDVGDGSTADGWLDGVDANAVASYASPGNTEAYQYGKYYSAADTIDVKTVNAADTAVMRLWAVVVDCS